MQQTLCTRNREREEDSVGSCEIGREREREMVQNLVATLWRFTSVSLRFKKIEI